MTKNYYVTSTQNLSQNNVKAIIQDDKGFIWLGTKNGLNRFDGKEVKVYNCYDEKKNIGNNNISSLYEDKNKNIWVGTDRGIYIYNPLTEKFHQFDIKAEQGVAVSDWVAQISEDKEQRIWIVIPNQGVFRFNHENNVLSYYPFIIASNQASKHPQCITILKSGEIWVGTNKDGLYHYNTKTDKFEQHLTDRNGVSIKDDMIYSICEYGDYIILGVHEGELKKYNYHNNTFSVVKSTDVHHKIIRDVKVFNNELWVGTEQGIYVIDEEAGKTELIRSDPMLSNSLSDNKIYAMYQDNEDGIWIGTVFGGVNYIPSQTLTIDRYIPSQQGSSVSGRIIRDLKEDQNGKIWVCTEDNGISIFNPKEQSFERITPTGGTQFIPQAIIENQNEIWVGLFKNGIDIYNLKTKNKKHLSPERLGIDESSIWALFQDRKGRIWLGNGWGVYSGNKTDLKFERHNEFGYNFIFDIYEDSKGNIWVCTMGNGVFKLKSADNLVEHYIYKQENPNTISSNSVSSVTEDRKGNLWFSTDRGGICKYNPETDTFKSYSKKEGLPDDIAYKIVEDNEGLLWFGTNHGLVRFNPDTESLQVFTEKDGINNNQFNYKSGIKTHSGKLYFGSINGLMSITPNEIKHPKFAPPLYITKLLIFNEEVKVNEKDSPLTNSIIYTNEVHLNHNQNSLGFEFASLSYSSSSNYKYSYKLENFDKDWTVTNDNRSVSYTNLSPGTYSFRVRATNSLGEWNDHETSIKIFIKAPWWQSTSASYLYVLLLLTAIIVFIYLYDRTQRKRYAQKMILADNQREKDIYNAKIEFFTDIAHEIRTPLILINGPLETILEETEINPPTIRKNMQIMEQNVKRLLDLINQLLDFRKIDERKFILNPANINLNSLVTKTIDRFQPMFEQKGKQLTLHITNDALTTYIDQESVIKIISNLMNNALKYSDKIIRVDLYATDDHIAHICVANDGTPIPDDLRNKIFEPFYRTTKVSTIPGSGIGLSLASSLAKLNNAELILDATSPLTTFILSIPLNANEQAIAAADEENIQEPIREPVILNENEEIEDEESEMKENSILIVEDEPEVRSYLSERLEKYFNVYIAANGVEALQILNEKYINIILSDLMMPEMDGIELCRNIKSNEDLAQIPFILLTAKTDMDSKMKSLETGADAYIEKPTTFNYLYKHINMLLKNREKEKKAFLNKPFFPVQKIKVSKSDEKFLNKIMEIINQDMANPELNVKNLADQLCMSRSGLHRKVKQITSLSPIEFIKLIRLKKAAELIQEGDYQIAEVCFMVGINSPSYFGKMFFQQFGMTPKEFAKNNKAGKMVQSHHQQAQN
ncbi:two-component regulator propeller domain-containing protein [Bacteroides sp.]